ncbi:hypothetical protein HC928_19605, partial [bacterium]|nr:hypothetical protein [bacterium]
MDKLRVPCMRGLPHPPAAPTPNPCRTAAGAIIANVVHYQRRSRTLCNTRGATAPAAVGRPIRMTHASQPPVSAAPTSTRRQVFTPSRA